MNYNLIVEFGESTWQEQLSQEDLERLYSEYGQWFMDALRKDVKKIEKS